MRIIAYVCVETSICLEVLSFFIYCPPILTHIPTIFFVHRFASIRLAFILNEEIRINILLVLFVFQLICCHCCRWLLIVEQYFFFFLKFLTKCVKLFFACSCYYRSDGMRSQIRRCISSTDLRQNVPGNKTSVRPLGTYGAL